MSWADNPVKHWQNLSLAIPNQISFISMHVASLVKIPWNLPIEICQSAIPKQISTISMYIPSLVKIHWCLLKLSSGNENMGVSRADSTIKIWRNLSISNPKQDLHNISAQNNLVKIHWCLLKLSSRKEIGMDRQTDVWLTNGAMNGWMDRWMDGQTHGRPTWNHNNKKK